MAASMNFCPGGAEYEEDDFDDDGFMFGCDDLEEFEGVRPNNVVPMSSTTDYSDRGGFGKPVQKGQTKQQEKIKTRNKQETKSLGMDDFRMAIIRNNKTGVEKYLNDGFNPNAVLKCGWTPLMYAVSNASPDIAQCLIGKGADVNRHRDMYTVLMAACASTANREEDIVRCVELLLEKGADVNARDRYHMSPLIYAAREGRVSVVTVLLDGRANIDKQDSRGWTSLSWAASKNHKDVVRLLIERGADVNKKHCDGQTVMDVTIAGDFREIMSLLSGKPVADNVKPPSQLSGTTTIPTKMVNGIGLMNGDAGMDDDSAYDPQSSVLKYGELELFLCGLDLGSLVSTFQQNQVDFAMLLRMTDEDLVKMGIDQLGVRKKILSGTQRVHRKDWEKSSLPSIEYNKHLTCVDSVAIVSNISKHTKYICSTVGYICDQVTADSNILLPKDGVTVRHLHTHVKGTQDHLQLLQREVNRLDAIIVKLSSSQNLDPPDVVTKAKVRNVWLNYRQILTVTAIVGVIGVVVYQRHSIQRLVTTLFEKT